MENLSSLTARKDLTPESQPVSERLRQTCRPHALLNFPDIVGDAPKLDGVMIEVRDGKTRSGITISGLAHRTRIQQIALFIFDLQGAVQLVISRMKL